MQRYTREHARIHAGLIAASGVVVAKQLPLREMPPVGLPSRLRPANVSDLPRLFRPDNETEPRRLARLSSAALVYSVDKKTTAYPERILRHDEVPLLKQLRASFTPPAPGMVSPDRSCPHCRLLYGAFYRKAKAEHGCPPIAVVNHSAHVNVTIDPDTNITEASIDNFQVLVPQPIAAKMLELSHPLDWAETPGSMFLQSDPVDRDGKVDPTLGDTVDKARPRWEQRAAGEGAFVLENVVWPLNEDIDARSENVIAIHNFDRPPEGNYGGAETLRFDYSLERCVRSNFGIAWERSGLDVDAGRYEAEAIPVDNLFAKELDEASPLAKLKRRDLLEMAAGYDPAAEAKLHHGWGRDEEDVKPYEIVEVVQRLGGFLEKAWGLPFVLLRVSASKRLHFTIPENGPMELWHILTWTAPSFLFTFLNCAVCLAPHQLIDSMLLAPAEKAYRHGAS
jgi:hypothetical protein